MTAGEGPYVWFLLLGFPPVPEVIGIYDEPPPEGQDTINATRVANIGAIPLLRGATRWRDRLKHAVLDLLP